jgi:hypothetical protein
MTETRCTSCGSQMAPKTKLCLECGYDNELGYKIEIHRGDEAEPRKPFPKVYVWSGVAAIALLAALWFVYPLAAIVLLSSVGPLLALAGAVWIVTTAFEESPIHGFICLIGMSIIPDLVTFNLFLAGTGLKVVLQPAFVWLPFFAAMVAMASALSGLMLACRKVPFVGFLCLFAIMSGASAALAGNAVFIEGNPVRNFLFVFGLVSFGIPYWLLYGFMELRRCEPALYLVAAGIGIGVLGQLGYLAMR